MNSKGRRKQQRLTRGNNALAISAAAIEPEMNGAQQSPAYDPEQEYFLGYGMSHGLGTQRYPAQKFDPCDQVSFETLRQMLNDPEISSDVRTLRDLVLSDGVEIMAAFQNEAISEDSPEYKRAQEIADHCKRSLQGLHKPLKATLEGLLEGAIVYGHKTAEITWQMGMGEDAGRLVLRRVALKDYRSLDFVLDSFSNHIGFTPRSAAVSGTSTQTIISREKFLHLALNEEDEDPRGRSSIRPANTAWNFKLSTWPEYYRWLQTAALPGLIGKLAPKQTGDVQRNTDGTVKSGGRQLSPAEAMASALEAMKSAGVAVVPNGAEVDQLEAAGEGAGYQAAINLADAQIGKAILRQTLATGEAQFGTRAQSQTHLEVLDMVVWNLRGHLARVLQKDIVRQMVRYNFGEEALPYTPTVAMGDSERRDWSKDATAASAIEGALTDSQWQSITMQLGIPAPLPGEQPRNRVMAEQMQPATGVQQPGDSGNDTPEGQQGARRRLASLWSRFTAPFVRMRRAN
jgi:hypothetical protein